ncbi:MAG: hypothetical protein ACLQU3_32325 [Limisphaerales bacterium]
MNKAAKSTEKYYRLKNKVVLIREDGSGEWFSFFESASESPQDHQTDGMWVGRAGLENGKLRVSHMKEPGFPRRPRRTGRLERQLTSLDWAGLRRSDHQD